MTYSDFINNTLNIVNKLINILEIVYSYLIENFIFKTIIYFILFNFIIFLTYLAYHFVLNVFNKNKKEIKTDNRKVE